MKQTDWMKAEDGKIVRTAVLLEHLNAMARVPGEIGAHNAAAARAAAKLLAQVVDTSPEDFGAVQKPTSAVS